MPEVITLDPALKKLLDNLPAEDPDPKRDWVDVWCVWTEARHRIPMYEEVTLNMGVWQGPDTKYQDIPIFAQHVLTGQKARFVPDIWRNERGTIFQGDQLELTITAEW